MPANDVTVNAVAPTDKNDNAMLCLHQGMTIVP